MADPRWNSVVRKHLPDLAQLLSVSALKLQLYSAELLSKSELQEVTKMLDADAAVHLLVHVLPRKGPTAYDTFVGIVLKTEGQKHIAERFLTQYDEDISDIQLPVIEADKSTGFRGSAPHQPISLTTDKLQIAAAQMQKAQNLEIFALKLTNVALHHERLLYGHHPSRQAKYRQRFAWTEWDMKLPSDKFLRGQVATTDNHLVVGGFRGQIHLLDIRVNDRQWKTVTRHGADICALACSSNFLIAMVYDKQTCQSVIESFDVHRASWYPLASLPSELQLQDVAMVVHGQFLYAVGGRTRCGKCVPTVRYLNLDTREWFPLPDMLTARSSCSVVVVDDTVIVGGGRNNEGSFSNKVETLVFGTEHVRWQEVTPTTRCDPTLVQFNGQLLALGGRDGETCINSATSSVEVLDVSISHEWLPLPELNLTWMSHGAAAFGNRLIVAGGMSSARYVIESAELN